MVILTCSYEFALCKALKLTFLNILSNQLPNHLSFFVKLKSFVQSLIERLDLGMISTKILILTLVALASLASAQPPPHHKVNGFVPPKRFGKVQLENEEMPRGFEVKAKQVIFNSLAAPSRSRIL